MDCEWLLHWHRPDPQPDIYPPRIDSYRDRISIVRLDILEWCQLGCCAFPVPDAVRLIDELTNPQSNAQSDHHRIRYTKQHAVRGADRNWHKQYDADSVADTKYDTLANTHL